MNPPVLYTVVGSSIIVMVGQLYYLLVGLPTRCSEPVAVVVAAVVYVNIMGGRARLKAVDDAAFQPSGGAK